MWVRDHARPAFHDALGVDIDWYDQEVFNKTSTIARQVFPIELDIDHPRWLPTLRRLEAAFNDLDAAKAEQGIGATLKRAFASARAGWAFLGLYTIPSKKNEVPVSVRLEPSY